MRDEIDTQLTAAFRDVPVPEGLAQRVLDRLAAEASHGCPLVVGEFVSETRQDAASTLVEPRRKRRWLAVAGELLTVAAAILLAVWLGWQQQGPLSEQLVLDEAIRSFNAEAAGAGKLLSKSNGPSEYPLSKKLLALRDTTYRPITGFLGGDGVVYDLPGPGKTRASLYVVNRKVEGLRTSPTQRPFTTAGCCASTWREGDLVYVLVVHGDRDDYKGYLNLPRTPVAFAWILLAGNRMAA